MYRTKYIQISLTLILISGLAYILLSPSIRNILVLATTAQPENYTELYFEDHQILPERAVQGNFYSFRFTVHNLENADVNYPYEVTITGDGRKQVLDKQSVLIKNKGSKTLKEAFILNKPVNSAEVAVNLINKNQQIDFWIQK